MILEDGDELEQYDLLRLISGQIQLRGDDVRTSEPPSGYQTERGNLQLENVEIQWNDRIYTNVNVYELLFVKTDYVPKEIATNEAEAQLEVVKTAGSRDEYRLRCLLY